MASKEAMFMNSKRFTVALLLLALAAARAVREPPPGAQAGPVGSPPPVPLHASPDLHHHGALGLMGRITQHLHSLMATAQGQMGEQGRMNHEAMAGGMPGLNTLAGEEFEQAFIAMMIAHHQDRKSVV